MRLLLDTHALIWLITDDARLGNAAREIIFDPANDVFVSIVSFWEMAVKIRDGKLGPGNLERVMGTVASHGMTMLPLEPRHIAELLRLPVHGDHRDPFDQQLIAQAIAEDLALITDDSNAPRYNVRRLGCKDASAT